MTSIYVFPGQGSQARGMGEGLFDRYPDETAAADAILGYSLRELCLEDPDDKLNHTAYTQPALFAVCALMYLDQRETAGAPDFAAGHSLGEYTALFAAGALDFATGVRLVQERGRIMTGAHNGGMAAVIGPDAADVERIIAESGLDSLDIANYNSPGQTVVSGPAADIAAAEQTFKDGGAKIYKILPVTGAFHSRYMAAAAAEFGAFLDTVDFAPLQFPVIANCSAEPYTDAAVRTNLLHQIDKSVRWIETVQRLRQEPDAEFIEIGPGKVLTGLIRRIK